jgi:hypothetical protein
MFTCDDSWIRHDIIKRAVGSSETQRLASTYKISNSAFLRKMFVFTPKALLFSFGTLEANCEQ